MSSASLRQESIREALRQVLEPQSGRDVLALGYLARIALCEGAVRITYALPAEIATAETQDVLRRSTISTLQGVDGVQQVLVDFGPAPSPDGPGLPGVKYVVAVGAGKGGVGKSTVAVLLAVGLQRRGLRVGLLDADVYGPSLPKLTGTEGAQPSVSADGRIVPPEFDGIRLLSIGHLIPADQAVIWRGPMAQKYVKEFLERGDWEGLDYVIVDLPPGTGDIPLTLAQSIPMTGAVVVCTPQDVALLDARKALRMYQRLGVEPLGMIENMSYYICPHCGQREHIFGEGGVARAASELGVPFLGGIPLNLAIRRFGDAGKPTANFTETDHDVQQALEQVVTALEAEVAARERLRKPLPEIKIRE